MATAEEIFKTTKLEVIVPEEPLEIPAASDADAWIRSLAQVKQRDKAFFDERLSFFFTVKAPHPGVEPVDPSVPPLELAQFLSHLQITLDAKYITPQQQRHNHRGVPGTARGTGRGISLAPPPRSHSYRNKSPLPLDDHPSIFPPHTPHPTPQTDEADRKYADFSAKTEGTVLESFVWGETQRDDPSERSFALLWSSSENIWVAVYRLNIGVSFLRTSITEPLLSLTVSTTLRQKPLKMTQERKALAALVSAAGGGQCVRDATPVTINGVDEPLEKEDELNGLEEVNLLDGLSQSPTFGGSNGATLTLPSVRLGASLRRTAYSLPPIQPGPLRSSTSTNAPAIIDQKHSSTPVLRKSFLKTLLTVSGFQIRMRSVFVPYVVLPGSVEDEGERREAGSEERTVVLSVELSNGSISRGPGATGFAVEGVEVNVGGEGAAAHLIAWDENGFKNNDAVFPLLLGSAEQFNMLYAITFLRQSEMDDVADTMRNGVTGETLPAPSGDAQRPVSIVIRGRPFDIPEGSHVSSSDVKNLSYPTQTFRSRWNCVLDLSSAAQEETYSQNFDVATEPPSARDALPAPASPFPVATPTTARQPVDRITSIFSQTSTSAVAGSKRHTIGGLSERGHRVTAPNPRYRASTSIITANNNNSSPISSAIPSSPAVGRSTTTPSSIFIPSIPPSPAGPRTPVGQLPPPTPAYPAYPSEVVPATPIAQSPISSLHMGGEPGASVEPRRERIISGGTPQTPGPRMLGAPFVDQTTSQDDDGDPVVVSVGLIPLAESITSDLDMVYALDTFGIEIFVFNRSGRTRRFEVSYPERKRRRHQVATTDLFEMGDKRINIGRQGPGILPLENRIRVGPLRPHSCQSVRMKFLALQPGLHSIHSLVLTDIETGYSKNLKSVMDVVVHEAYEVP